MKPELKRNLKHAVVDLEFFENEKGAEAVEEVISYCEELESKVVDQDNSFHCETTIYNELVFERFKKFLEDVNLSYHYKYNPVAEFWNVFVTGYGNVMQQAVKSAIALFIDIEKYFKENEKNERSR